jgi:type II secretory pathway pseudopilin PulG
MFSLIIAIVSILLVGALALATVYYGGTSFLMGSERAQIARVMNEGSQVEGAIRLFRVEQGRLPESPDELTDPNHQYLQALPTGSGELEASKFQFGDDYVFAAVSDAKVCEAINAKMGIEGAVPMCSDPSVAGTKVCCENDD